jgi:hypothetical protein
MSTTLITKMSVGYVDLIDYFCKVKHNYEKDIMLF